MSSRDVITALRGRIVKKPNMKMWSINTVNENVKMWSIPTVSILKEKFVDKHMNFQDEKDVYAYTCEKVSEWTPFNSNLHMQGIKVGRSRKYPPHDDGLYIQVLVKDPLPSTAKKADSFENTLLILDMVRNKNREENEKFKVQIC